MLHLHFDRTRFCFFSYRNVHIPKHNEEEPSDAQKVHKRTYIIVEIGLLWKDGMEQYQYHTYYPVTLLCTRTRWNAIDNHR